MIINELLPVIRFFSRYLEAFDYKPAHLVPESMQASQDDLNAIGQLINDKYTSPADKFIFSENNFVNVCSFFFYYYLSLSLVE